MIPNYLYVKIKLMNYQRDELSSDRTQFQFMFCLITTEKNHRFENIWNFIKVFFLKRIRFANINIFRSNRNHSDKTNKTFTCILKK